ncbi:MAG: ankyrin repeat domain-containing protein [Pseudobdellovibrionaceae bacterium]
MKSILGYIPGLLLEAILDRKFLETMLKYVAIWISVYFMFFSIQKGLIRWSDHFDVKNSKFLTFISTWLLRLFPFTAILLSNFLIPRVFPDWLYSTKGAGREEVKISAAAARVQPFNIHPGETFEITYRWQGGPSPGELEVYTVLGSVGSSPRSSPSLSISDDLLPPTQTTQWRGITEYSKRIAIPKNFKPGSYPIWVALRNVKSHENIKLNNDGVSLGSYSQGGLFGGYFLIGQIFVSDPSSYQPLRSHEREITPLMEAAYQGDLQKLELLLPKEKGNQKLFDQLLLYASGGGPITNQVYSGGSNVVEYLLNHGANPNALNGLPLVNAAIHGNENTLKLLLDRGADINLRPNSMTALLAAIIYRHEEIVSILLEHNANPNIPDNSGLSPLDHAKIINDLYMIDALKKAGAQ